MVCEWFSFLSECDIPNWLALLIEIILGTTLALIFFGWQWNIRAHRRDAGQAKIIPHLIWLKQKLVGHEKVLNDYFDKKISIEQLAKDKDKRSYHLNQLQISINLFHDTMDSEISSKIDDIIDYSTWDTVDEKEVEIKHNQVIIKKIDYLLEKFFKKRTKYVEKLLQEKDVK